MTGIAGTADRVLNKKIGNDFHYIIIRVHTLQRRTAKEVHRPSCSPWWKGLGHCGPIWPVG